MANIKAIDNIQRYLQDKQSELRPHLLPPLVLKYAFRVDWPACPEQRNSYDCGVLASQIANYLTSDVRLVLTQADMPILLQQFRTVSLPTS